MHDLLRHTQQYIFCLPFAEILKCMTWAAPTDFTVKKFKTFLNKQPNEERRKKMRKEQKEDGKTGKKVCVTFSQLDLFSF